MKTIQWSHYFCPINVKAMTARTLINIFLGVSLLGLASCANNRKALSYRPLTQVEAATIRVGMTLQEVQLVLGTASIIDPFHARQLFYIFQDPQTKDIWRMAVHFNAEGQVIKIVTNDEITASSFPSSLYVPVKKSAE